ncbi:MAG: winged helix-turn-helix transcriptional regulator [Deltaproteobacteria bacterium]|nr:winged helix-turn-helix transcriptional regulator [Deltaproteobacteria bacterium]MBW2362175.1 winged helix-turn-helix transcriptional regulator [Deltaproteobacteria bacterium]
MVKWVYHTVKGVSPLATTTRDDLERDLEAASLASTGQLLIRAARLFNERAIARSRVLQGIDLRPAHTALFPHLSFEGTRTTVLAKKMGITKQAAGQIVAELERVGVLCRVPDPSDGRAKLVRFTTAGHRALMAGIGVLREVEDELAAELGEALMGRLNRDLAKLLAAFERAAS